MHHTCLKMVASTKVCLYSTQRFISIAGRHNTCFDSAFILTSEVPNILMVHEENEEQLRIIKIINTL